MLDLDDTLYLERDYVRSGFDAVGHHLAHRGVGEGFAAHAWVAFEGGLRNTIFDTVLGSMQIADRVTVAELVEIYRRHEPSIALCPDASRFLSRFPRDRSLGMITDGPVASQSAKIRALGLEGRLAPIVMSDTYGVAFRKPHERPFLAIEQAFDVDPREITYIADNPLKDFVTPRRRGWHTIRMQRPFGEHTARAMAGEHAACDTISDFDELIV